MNVTEAVQSRRSVRAFLDTPVEREMLARILEKAQRSPSGGNTQPWHGILLTGDPLQKLFDRIAEEFPKGRAAHAPEYHVYPPELAPTNNAAAGWAKICTARSKSPVRRRPSA